MSQEKTAQTNPETQKSPETPKAEKKPVDPSKYERYTNLKFIKLDGGQLREDYEKELVDLEKELKACSGKKAAKTRTASIGMSIIKFVEGMPVPKEIFDLVPEKDRGFYFV